MFDNFLPIPDAEFLPFYPLVLKLAVCVRAHGPVGGGASQHGVAGFAAYSRLERRNLAHRGWGTGRRGILVSGCKRYAKTRCRSWSRSHRCCGSSVFAFAAYRESSALERRTAITVRVTAVGQGLGGGKISSPPASLSSGRRPVWPVVVEGVVLS